MEGCNNCEHYIQDYDIKRNCTVKKCAVYPQFDVYGHVDGLINPACNQFKAVFVTEVEHKSLKEKTLIRAGGTWDSSEVKRAAIAKMIETKHERKMQRKGK